MLTGDFNFTLGYTVRAGILSRTVHWITFPLSQPSRADAKHVY